MVKKDKTGIFFLKHTRVIAQTEKCDTHAKKKEWAVLKYCRVKELDKTEYSSIMKTLLWLYVSICSTATACSLVSDDRY